jgi:ribosomal protein L21E
MPHSFGYRGKTRDLFQKKFREHGTLPTQRFLRPFKLGQFVDIKADPAQQKGMPHKYYHGKTGIVWNVTKRAIGVQVRVSAQRAGSLRACGRAACPPASRLVQQDVAQAFA